MARSLNIVIGADIEKLQKGFNDAVSVVQSSGKKMSEAAAETAKSIQDRLASIATKNPTAGTVRQLTNLAMEARALGPEFAGVANQIIQQAGRIKDSIGDARAEVGYFASDTRRLDAVLGGVQAIAGAFSAVQGATALLGVEDKELQQTMAKLQGAIALVNGVQAIQNALQAESAFMVGLQTAATRIQTFVLGQATVAARAYAAALVATGVGAIIVGLSLIASALEDNADAAEKAEEAQKKYAESLEAQNNRFLDYRLKRIEAEKQLAIKRAQLAGASEQAIAKIELEAINKKIALMKKMRNELTDDSKLKTDLIYKIQEAEDEAALKSLDIDIAKKKSRQQTTEETKKQNAEIKKSAEETAKAEASFIEWLEKKRFETGEKAKKKAIEDAKLLTAANLQAGTANTPVYLDVKINPVSYSEAAKDIQKATQALNSAFATLQADAAASFGQFLGDLATGEKEAGKNFGKNMLGAIAAFMDSLGKALVATALASEAFQKLVLTNPAAAAAAGIALIAGATIVRNSLKQGPEVTAFAEGGIVSGPTLGLVGEYPGASSNPEVIAPLDKLKGMLNMNNNNSGFVASTTIQGRDLAIVLERYNKDARRG
jgi:hypothetical protein